jgi:hypothetical protein
MVTATGLTYVPGAHLPDVTSSTNCLPKSRESSDSTSCHASTICSTSRAAA